MGAPVSIKKEVLIQLVLNLGRLKVVSDNLTSQAALRVYTFAVDSIYKYPKDFFIVIAPELGNDAILL